MDKIIKIVFSPIYLLLGILAYLIGLSLISFSVIYIILNITKHI